MKRFSVAAYLSAVASQFSICFRLSQLCRYCFNRGGLQGSPVSYEIEDVRDGFPRTPLNKRALLPHVCSFLELHCDLQRVSLFGCTGATSGLASIGQINDCLPIGRMGGVYVTKPLRVTPIVTPFNEVNGVFQ